MSKRTNSDASTGAPKKRYQKIEKKATPIASGGSGGAVGTHGATRQYKKIAKTAATEGAQEAAASMTRKATPIMTRQATPRDTTSQASGGRAGSNHSDPFLSGFNSDDAIYKPRRKRPR